MVRASGNLEVFSQMAKRAKEQADALEKGVGSLSAEAGKSGEKVMSLDDALDSLSIRSIAAAGGVLGLLKGLQGLAGGVRDIIQGSVEAYSGFEQMQTGLSGVLQSAELGKEVFEDLRQFSLETTFGVDTLAGTSQQLLTVGVSLGELRDTLTQLGNVAGGSTEKFNRVSEVFVKILATGKATSDQIQQLSSITGVSWINVLKEMGVTGTASAEDIRSAFEELTSEGNVFYGTMDAINDTIEGRMGFVTDTLTEIKVAFADASGMADTYKAALGFIYEALQGVLDGLLSVSGNPVYKAVLSGALTAALTGLVAVIGTTLFLAVKKLNTQLAVTATLKALVNPAAAAAGLIAAGIAGATVAVIAHSRAVDKASDTYKKLQDAAKQTEGRIRSLKSAFEELTGIDASEFGAFDVKNTGTAEYFEETGKAVKDGSAGVIEAYTYYVRSLQEAYRELDRYRSGELPFVSSKVSKIGRNIKSLKNEISAIQEEYKDLLEKNETWKAFTGGIETDGTAVNQRSIDSWKDFADETERIKSAVAEIPLDDLESKIAGVRAQVDSVRKYMTGRHSEFTGGRWVNNIGLTEEQLADARTLLVRYQEELDSLNLEKFKAEMRDWQKVMQDVFSFEDQDLQKYLGTGKAAADEYVRRINEGVEKAVEFNRNLGLGDNRIEEQFKAYRQMSGAMDSLRSSGLWNGTEESMQTLKSELDRLASILRAANVDLETGEVEESQPEKGFSLAESIWNNSGKLTGQITSQLGDMGTLIEDYIGTAKQTVEAGLDENGNFTNITAAVSSLKNGIVGSIMEFAGWLVSYMLSKDSEEENIKDLTDEYKALISAMEETEEYYLSRKKELSSADTAAGVTGVHDMILTPEGNFSTDPADYLIATKNPESLASGGGGQTVINVSVVNEMGSEASVSAEQTQDADGTEQLMIRISRRVAYDYMNGDNGWDGAVTSRERSGRGRDIVVV